MRILIASDQDRDPQRIRAVLASHGMECPSGHSVPLELAVDRASRLRPDLLVLVLPQDPTTGLAALRETRNTLPNVYVVAIGRATDPKFILRILHEGADEFVDEGNLDAELQEALRRFKSREVSTPEHEQSGKVIAVMGASGGSGSSMVASNISVVLAAKYGECGLIDLRLAAGDLASMLDLQPTRSIADLCEHLTRLDQSLFAQFLTRHRSGVHLLANSGDMADLRRVTCKGVRRAMAMARIRFPYVVADLDNGFGAEQVEALWQSDVIVLVMRLDYTSIRNTRRAMQNCAEMGLGVERVRLVVNGYGQRRQLTAGQVEDALGMKILHYIPNDPASVNQAINKGVPVVLHRPSAKVSKEILRVAASVNGRDSHKTPS
jgi:pilus assembly protein CpaE